MAMWVDDLVLSGVLAILFAKTVYHSADSFRRDLVINKTLTIQYTINVPDTVDSVTAGAVLMTHKSRCQILYGQILEIR